MFAAAAGGVGITGRNRPESAVENSMRETTVRSADEMGPERTILLKFNREGSLAKIRSDES